MRDLIVFGITMLLLPTSFRRPFVGLLLFSWLAYMRPQDLCWGFARTMRLSFLVGIAMIVGWWANERGRRPFMNWDFRTSAMLGLGGIVTVSYAFAFHHDAYTNVYYVEFIKILVVALFTTGQVDTRQRFRTLVWTIAMCLAFFGVKNGVLGVLTGGRQILRGPGGMLEDNNDFALAMVMNVPLLWYMSRGERPWWVWPATKVALVLTVITILLTHSRGAFLALVVASLWIAWRSGKLVRAFGLLALLALLFPVVVPASVIERLSTIGDTQDSSQSARLNSWATAFKMIEDNPGLGVGLRNFHTSYRKYSVVQLPQGAKAYVAHNSYLQIWAECGSFAIIVYLALLGSVFFASRHVSRIGSTRPELAWLSDYGRMMEATTVGFMVGGFFLNRGHFDLIYHWLALCTALMLVAHAAYREGPHKEVRESEAVGRREVVVSWRPVVAASGVGEAGVRAAPRWGRLR